MLPGSKVKIAVIDRFRDFTICGIALHYLTSIIYKTRLKAFINSILQTVQVRLRSLGIRKSIIFTFIPVCTTNIL
ncbi:hypothetical protein NTGBS_160048 [Candidatus Nitrotoga sp. BS]|nr:hypothetical protein NTGBS_160048 [Candidatus Nitrotoga sp. BS]